MRIDAMLTGPGRASDSEGLGMDEALATAIGVEGYTYLYPLLLMDVTRAQATNVVHPGDLPFRGPAGAFVHARQFPEADFRDVVRPNFDTLYSAAWIDLSKEPAVLSVPDPGDLYYLLPMYNMFGEVFASPGSRTMGAGAQTILLTGPDWSGAVPSGMTHVPSNHRTVWIIGRTQASVATYGQVHAFQDGLALTRLSDWEAGHTSTVTGIKDPSIDDTTPPLRTVFVMEAAAFFGRAADLLEAYPGYVYDRSIQLRLERVGFVAGQPFDLSAQPLEVQQGLGSAVPIAQARITARQASLGTAVNGWRVTAENMGSYGQDYLQRAVVELIGLGANLPEDAIYPVTFVDSDGEPYDGSHDYVLHFDADALPPANAFWSLTLYDGEGFQVPNAINRFALGNRDPLPYNPDGSLDLLIQHAAPGADSEGRWLPAPKGAFNLCLRLYDPRPSALDGSWVPPAVRKA
ncbi:MAG: DUF1254 domain-containing protein [Gemmatimonadota bacterium]|nr:DUF1254 domain-containing protein [Gemmatimonadota bacterium]